jgi:hypothetical protein
MTADPLLRAEPMTRVGADGLSAGVAEGDGAEGGLVPASLVAETVKL